MELKAIIGKKRNYQDSIKSYLSERENLDNYGILKNCGMYETYSTKIKDFYSFGLYPFKKGKNIYIHIVGLKDPLAFYQYLSEKDFILVDSKLTKEAGE